MSIALPDPYRLDKRGIAQAFGRAAAGYEQQAVLQRTVAERMVERLEVVRIKPDWVLDVGGGTGYAARLLSKRYPRARILLLDLSHEMLLEARRRAPRFFSHERYVQGDAEALPLSAASADMIFSSLTLQWCNEFDQVFREFRRILKVDGLVMLSTLGPDTLKELRRSWAEVDDDPHVHAFVDMHDLGDALIRAGFSSPVLDVERFILTYKDLYALMRDLKALGASNRSMARRRGLTGKRSLAKLQQGYEHHRREGLLPATYEVVYGHAWVPEQDTRPQDGSTVATFPLAELRRSRREHAPGR
jgi:malonyl-CoA O-methyltransferase